MQTADHQKAIDELSNELNRIIDEHSIEIEENNMKMMSVYKKLEKYKQTPSSQLISTIANTLMTECVRISGSTPNKDTMSELAKIAIKEFQKNNV